MIDKCGDLLRKCNLKMKSFNRIDLLYERYECLFNALRLNFQRVCVISYSSSLSYACWWHCGAVHSAKTARRRRHWRDTVVE